MVHRVAPSNSKNTKRAMTKKSVSFGESTVHSVEAVASAEEAALIWYKQTDLDELLEAEKEGLRNSEQQGQSSKKKTTKPSENEQFSSRGLESKLLTPGRSNHVRHVLKIYKLKQKKAPVDPEDLRKTARFSSKKNEAYALEQGKKDYREAHGKQGLVKRAKARMGMIFR